MITMTNGLTATKEFKDVLNELIMQAFEFSFDNTFTSSDTLPISQSLISHWIKSLSCNVVVHAWNGLCT